MKHAEKIRLIESYYRGDICDADQLLFDALLKEDSTFSEEVTSYETIFRGFESLHLEKLQEQLFSFEQKYKEKVSKAPVEPETIRAAVVRPIRSYYYAAAAVAVLVFAVFGYNQMNSSPFENNFVADGSIAIHLSSMRAGDQTLSPVEILTRDAYAAYQEQNYDNTIKILSLYQDDYPEIASKDYQSFLVLGVAFLANGAANDAKLNFNKILEAKDSSNKLSAQWYLSLAEIKLNNFDAAQSILEDLSNCEDSKLKDDATQLLQDL